jgi:hypothetical protein
MKASLVDDRGQAVLSLLNGRIHMPLTSLMRHVHAQPDDLVVIAGSLIEGIGNWTSDFDIYVFADTRRTEFPAAEHHRRYNSKEKVGTFDFMDDFSFSVDVYYHSYAELEDLTATMRLQYQQRMKRTKIAAADLPKYHQKLAHRLFDSLIVQGEQRLVVALAGLTRVQYGYVAYRQYACSYPDFRDIVGSWRLPDLDTCVYQARHFLRWQMMAFTHLNGNVNMNEKWVFQLAKRLPTQYAALAERFIQTTLGACATDSEKRAVVIECLDVCDLLFEAARPILNRNPDFLPCDLAMALTRTEREGYSRWHTEVGLEFAFRSRLFSDGLPPLRDFLNDQPTPALAKLLRDDPFRPLSLDA